MLESANAGRQARLVEELAVMKPLPPNRLAEYRELCVVVSSQSTIRVKNARLVLLVGQRRRWGLGRNECPRRGAEQGEHEAAREEAATGCRL